LRPCDLPDARIDVRAYRNANDDFPHQTTLNQWFSESQFESYRGLGDTEMSAIGGQPDPAQPIPLLRFFCDVHEDLARNCETERDLGSDKK
jgi:hypothetical protein